MKISSPSFPALRNSFIYSRLIYLILFWKKGVCGMQSAYVIERSISNMRGCQPFDFQALVKEFISIDSLISIVAPS